MSLQYTSRELAAMSPKALWDLPEGPIRVVFDPLDDGTEQILDSTVALTRFSAYMWGTVVTHPRTPSRISHHIGSERLRDDTHMKLLNKVLWDCYAAYEGEVDREILWRAMYVAYNRYYNDYTTMVGMEEEISTISLEDLVDVVDEPRIAEAIRGIDEANGTQVSIDHAHQVAIEVLKDPTALPGNPISCSVRSGTVSNSQILQCLIAHGPASDLSSRRFAEPIPSSFLSGMNTLFESLAESRTNTISEAFKEKPIKESEYFNRRLQLLASTFRDILYTTGIQEGTRGGLSPGDCGSTRTLRWTVKDNGKDLRSLAGLYYQNNDGGLTAVSKDDTHLVGQTLHLRIPPLCRFAHQQQCCATCYGQIAESMPSNTNVGHVAALVYGAQVTQRMLGIKHVNFASGSRQIVLGAYEKEFMEVGPSPREIRLKATVAQARRVLLSFAPAEAQLLNEVFYESAERLPVSRISDVGRFYLTIEREDGTRETVLLSGEVQRTRSHMSRALLEHVQQTRYTLSTTGRYVIDLTGFDFRQPILEVPNRNENIMDYLNSIIRFIASAKSDKGQTDDEGVRKLSDCKTLEEAMVHFHELTSSKMEVNLVHLSILVFSTMVRSPNKGDYRLPGLGNEVIFAQLDKIIPARSLGAALAFEGHSRMLADPATYLNPYRQDNYLDDLLVPRNAIM